jgi:hypothetical protein
MDRLALRIVVAGSVLGGAAHAQEGTASETASKGKQVVGQMEVDWGVPVHYARWRGHRTRVCRPEPCIAHDVEVVPYSVSAAVFVGHTNTKVGHDPVVQLLEGALLLGFGFGHEASEPEDVYVGAGIATLNRYIMVSVAVDLWRRVSEPGGPSGLSSGVLQGSAGGPEGFRLRENLSILFSIDLTAPFRKGEKGQ